MGQLLHIKANDKQYMPNINSLKTVGRSAKNLSSNLFRLPLMSCVFLFALFFTQNVHAQILSGSYTFGNSNEYSFDYTVEYSSDGTQATVTVDYTTSTVGLGATQLRLGNPTDGYSFVNLSGDPLTATIDLPVEFSFYIAFPGGQFISPPENVVAPVTLSNFSAIVINAKSVKLDWNTSTEINSEFFGVERSIDGLSWENIGEVQAAGNSNTNVAYSFIDRDIVSNRTDGNIYYYRLKMTDLDATFEYSDIRGVNFAKSNNIVVSIFPNPTTDRINIDLSSVSVDAGTVKVGLYTQSGSQVINKTVIGSGIELLDVANLTSAIYHIVVTQGSEMIYQTTIIKAD